VLEAVIDNSSVDPSFLDPFSEIYNQSESYVRRSTVIVEEIESADESEFIPESIAIENEATEFSEPNDYIRENEDTLNINNGDDCLDDNFYEASSHDDALIESIINTAEDDKTLNSSQINEISNTICEEKSTELGVEEKSTEITEEANLTCGVLYENFKDDSKEIKPNIEDNESPQIEIQAECDIDTKKENSPDVMMKVEISVSEDQSLGQTALFRMSLESLPTTSLAAEEMQSQINAENLSTPAVLSASTSIVSLTTSESFSTADHDQDSRCSTPRIDGRAGRYNKKPAPPRPKENQDEEGPLKARLVLKPGVVRALPEDSTTSQSETKPLLFLNPNAKEKKMTAKESKSSLLNFWHSKPVQSENSSSSNSKQMTDL